MVEELRYVMNQKTQRSLMISAMVLFLEYHKS